MKQKTPGNLVKKKERNTENEENEGKNNRKKRKKAIALRRRLHSFSDERR